MELQNGSDDYIILGQSDDINKHAYKWLTSCETDEHIDRIIIKTLAEIKTWQYRQNPRTPLRQIVLNRNLYNSFCCSLDL